MSVQSLRAAEARLQQAVLESDVDALDALLHDNMRYVGPGGADYGKAAELEAHRDSRRRLTELTPLKVEASLHPGEIGEIRSTLAMAGEVNGEAFSGTFIYNRTWLFDSGQWRVVAATGEIV